MKIKIALIFCTISLFFFTVKGQDLISYGSSPNIYLLHKVTPKESWFSVGRLYNVNAKELAKFNKLSVEKGLVINQSIKIPISSNNLVADLNTITSQEAAIPYYRIIGKSEGLYRTALNTGTTMQALRNYNNLTSDNLPTGTKLIVGYLKVKKSESSLINNEVKGLDVPPPIEEKAEVSKKENPIPEKVIVKKEEPIKQKEITEIVKETPKEAPPVLKQEKPSPSNDNNKEGFFIGDYVKQSKYNKVLEGNAATFKTMAGWNDNKFYALIDGVQAGSILQVTNKANGKTVYAKVLGEMQELKQNNGLKIRLSNAAAFALNANEDVFIVEIKY